MISPPSSLRGFVPFLVVTYDALKLPEMKRATALHQWYFLYQTRSRGAASFMDEEQPLKSVICRRRKPGEAWSTFEPQLWALRLLPRSYSHVIAPSSYPTLVLPSPFRPFKAFPIKHRHPTPSWLATRRSYREFPKMPGQVRTGTREAEHLRKNLIWTIELRSSWVIRNWYWMCDGNCTPTAIVRSGILAILWD